MAKISVAITGAMGPAGRALLRQCEHLNVASQVLALDMVPATVWPQHEVMEQATDPRYIPHLAQLLAAHHIPLLIPTVSEELHAVSLAKLSGTFPAFTYVSIDSPQSVAWANDKYLTMQQLTRHHVPVPLFGLPSHFTSTAAVFRRWRCAAIVAKPRIARGGRGVQVFDSPEQMAKVWPRLDDTWVLQSFAGGTEYAPMVYRSASDRALVVLEKTQLAQGRVGNAVETKITEAPDVAHVALQAIEALGLQHPVDMDIRRDDTGTPLVLEVNARFGANSDHAPQIFLAVLASATAHSRKAFA